jgi:uncharacterized protein YggU (UPF0235/DUF167 family)
MYIHVTVLAGSKKESLVKTKDDYYLIAVKEKAQRNMANTRIREILGKEYNVPIGSVRIVNGHTSPKKLIDIALYTT